TGFGSVTISANGIQSSGNVNIAAVYPNLFAQSGDGLAAAYVTRVTGTHVSTDSVSAPIDVAPAGDQVYLILAATGLGNASSATATIGGVEAQVVYAGSQGVWPGLDQINVLIPRSLAGKGRVDVILTAVGKVSNPVYI